MTPRLTVSSPLLVSTAASSDSESDDDDGAAGDKAAPAPAPALTVLDFLSARALNEALPRCRLQSGDGMSLLGVYTPYGSFPVAEDGYTAGPAEYDGDRARAPTTLVATPLSTEPLDDAVRYFEVS